MGWPLVRYSAMTPDVTLSIVLCCAYGPTFRRRPDMAKECVRCCPVHWHNCRPARSRVCSSGMVFLKVWSPLHRPQSADMCDSTFGARSSALHCFSLHIVCHHSSCPHLLCVRVA